MTALQYGTHWECPKHGQLRFDERTLLVGKWFCGLCLVEMLDQSGVRRVEVTPTMKEGDRAEG